MAFEKYTSGFVVDNKTIGIEAAKITSSTEGVVTAFGAENGSIPTVGAITAWASTATVCDAEKLGGQTSAYYAKTDDVKTISGFFDVDGNGIANKAASAAEADKLKTPVSFTFEGDVSGTIASFDGSQNVTATLTIPAPAKLTANADSTVAGFATASATEKALAAVIEKVDGIGAYEVVHGKDEEGTPDVNDPSGKIIYLTKITGKEPDAYKEWIYTSTGFELIGETTLDLTNYVQETDETYTVTTAYAADWNSTKNNLITSAAEGAAASAAISGAITGKDAFIEDNKGKLATVGAISAYVANATDNLTSAGKWNEAYDTLTATSGDWNDAHNVLTATSANWNEAYETVTASADEWNTAYETVSAGKVTTSADMTTTNADKLATVGAITSYVDSKTGAVSGYSHIYVDDAKHDAGVDETLKLKSGEGIQLTTGGDDAGKPTVTFSATYSNLAMTSKVGSTEAAAITPTTDDGTVTYGIEIPTATTAAEGVTKASYYDENDKYIHIF